MNPPTSPTEAILFSTCFLCALKGSWGGSFCIERLSMNVPFDRYHTTELGRKKKRTSHSFPLSWRYIKCCTRKTVYEKVFFFSSILYCDSLVRTAETSFFVNNKRNPVWYISLGEYKKLLIYIARKLNNIHNMCNLCSYYQCCSLYMHVY